MTIIEAITEVDSLVPGNGVSESDKRRWLSRFDGTVKRDVLDTHEGDAVEFDGYTDDTPDDTVLLVGEPYADVYVFLLEAMVHYINGEMDRYNNAMTQHINQYEAYKKWYNRTHMPKETRWKL